MPFMFTSTKSLYWVYHIKNETERRKNGASQWHDFRLCEELLGLIADEYLDMSDRFHAGLDAKERMG